MASVRKATRRKRDGLTRAILQVESRPQGSGVQDHRRRRSLAGLSAAHRLGRGVHPRTVGARRKALHRPLRPVSWRRAPGYRVGAGARRARLLRELGRGNTRRTVRTDQDDNAAGPPRVAHARGERRHPRLHAASWYLPGGQADAGLAGRRTDANQSVDVSSGREMNDKPRRHGITERKSLARRFGWLAITLLATLTAVPTGQSGAVRGEWPTYGGDLGHTRYAPLDQITAANFNNLEVAWRFKTDNLGPRPEFNLQSTPLMVRGRLYSTGGTRRAVVALDAGTGELLWVHSEDEGARGAASPRQLSGRGLAYWSDGKEERILYVTPGYRLIALDARTGNPIAGFGRGGAIDLKADLDPAMDLTSAPIGLHATPIVAGNVVIVGAAFETGANPKSRRNIKGAVRGFDVRTGKRLWIFKTIPEPGEVGHETWENDSWAYTGNTGVWAQISVDEELGMAYLPVELPTHDYYGGARPGNGLFGESLVAIDYRTGERKWHYQLVHHGLWDMDIPCAPILADIRVNGRTIK